MLPVWPAPNTMHDSQFPFWNKALVESGKATCTYQPKCSNQQPLVENRLT